MKIKQKKKTVAEKVNEILLKKNAGSSDESSAEEAEPRVTECDDDEYELPQAQTTEFRKRNVKLLSEQSAKYKGKVSSRKELEEEEQESEEDGEDFYEASDSEEAAAESEEDDNSSTDGVFKTFAQKLQNLQQDKSVTPRGLKRKREESEESDETEEEDEDERSPSENEETVDVLQNPKLVSEKNLEAEMHRNKCIQNQLKISESIMEMRIKSHQAYTKAKDLPDLTEFNNISSVQAAQKATVQSVATLLNKLSELQVAFGDNVKFVHTPVDVEKVDAQTISKHFGEQLQHNFEQFREYRNKVLRETEERMKVLASNKSKSGQNDCDILKKIDDTLKSRLARLAEATAGERLKTYVYDDTDFYHQQLREFIESKASTAADLADMTNQHLELQNVRQKMKKKVDTRASKGRKIR